MLGERSLLEGWGARRSSPKVVFRRMALGFSLHSLSLGKGHLRQPVAKSKCDVGGRTVFKKLPAFRDRQGCRDYGHYGCTSLAWLWAGPIRAPQAASQLPILLLTQVSPGSYSLPPQMKLWEFFIFNKMMHEHVLTFKKSLIDVSI